MALWILFYAFPIKAYVKHVTLRMGPFWQHGHYLNNLVEGSTKWYYIPINKALCQVVPDKKIFMRSLYKPIKHVKPDRATFGPRAIILTKLLEIY